MEKYKRFHLKLEHSTYTFYNEIAKSLKRPVEDIMSDTLYKFVEILMQEANKKE